MCRGNWKLSPRKRSVIFPEKCDKNERKYNPMKKYRVVFQTEKWDKEKNKEAL